MRVITGTANATLSRSRSCSISPGQESDIKNEDGAMVATSYYNEQYVRNCKAITCESCHVFLPSDGVVKP